MICVLTLRYRKMANPGEGDAFMGELIERYEANPDNFRLAQQETTLHVSHKYANPGNDLVKQVMLGVMEETSRQYNTVFFPIKMQLIEVFKLLPVDPVTGKPAYDSYGLERTAIATMEAFIKLKILGPETIRVPDFFARICSCLENDLSTKGMLRVGAFRSTKAFENIKLEYSPEELSLGITDEMKKTEHRVIAAILNRMLHNSDFNPRGIARVNDLSKAVNNVMPEHAMEMDEQKAAASTAKHWGFIQQIGAGDEETQSEGVRKYVAFLFNDTLAIEDSSSDHPSNYRRLGASPSVRSQTIPSIDAVPFPTRHQKKPLRLSAPSDDEERKNVTPFNRNQLPIESPRRIEYPQHPQMVPASNVDMTYPQNRPRYRALTLEEAPPPPRIENRAPLALPPPPPPQHIIYPENKSSHRALTLEEAPPPPRIEYRAPLALPPPPQHVIYPENKSSHRALMLEEAPPPPRIEYRAPPPPQQTLSLRDSALAESFNLTKGLNGGGVVMMTPIVIARLSSFSGMIGEETLAGLAAITARTIGFCFLANAKQPIKINNWANDGSLSHLSKCYMVQEEGKPSMVYGSTVNTSNANKDAHKIQFFALNCSTGSMNWNAQPRVTGIVHATLAEDFPRDANNCCFWAEYQHGDDSKKKYTVLAVPLYHSVGDDFVVGGLDQKFEGDKLTFPRPTACGNMVATTNRAMYRWDTHGGKWIYTDTAPPEFIKHAHIYACAGGFPYMAKRTQKQALFHVCVGKDGGVTIRRARITLSGGNSSSINEFALEGRPFANFSQLISNGAADLLVGTFASDRFLVLCLTRKLDAKLNGESHKALIVEFDSDDDDVHTTDIELSTTVRCKYVIGASSTPSSVTLYWIKDGNLELSPSCILLSALQANQREASLAYSSSDDEQNTDTGSITSVPSSSVVVQELAD